MTSSKPYLIRAIYQWLVDNRLTPYLMIDADFPDVLVPEHFIEDGKIVLNIAPDTVQQLVLSSDWVSFDARFSGVTHRIRLPVQTVTAIYAVENGRGMVFDPEEISDDLPPENTPPKSTGKPQLKVMK